MKHPATIDRNHRPVPDDIRTLRGECKERFRPGDRVWIQVTKQRRVSDPVRRYYYGCVLQMIQGHTGQDKESLHDFFKRHFLGTEEDEFGIVTAPSVFSNTSKLAHEDRIQFVDDVRYFASGKLDVSIPDPDPEWRKRAA